MNEATHRDLVRPGEGKSVWLGGVGVDFKILGEQTRGLLAVVEHPMEPGRLVPPHVHYDTDEYSYVLQGEVGARVGDQELSAGAGTYLLKPRNVPHTIWNAGPKPARVIEMISPAGFERFFEELAEIFAAAGTDPPDEQRLGALGARYNLSFVHSEWVPELKQKYGLKLLGEP
jgi:quercetin dioxygenase-like cupin family protein